MSRIDDVFKRLQQQGRKGLIPFITAGDPSPGMTVALMQALVKGGADVIELGVPFSDPMADGPTIQRASERALKQGMSLRGIFDLVAQFRRTDSQTPVVLMGYANPIEAMGVDAFIAGAKQAQVDGMLVVDYPPQESREFASAMKQNGLSAIYLLAPTSTAARIEEVRQLAQGYVYYVSLTGVTGAKSLDISDVAAKLPEIREKAGLPVGVGFGIRDASSAKQIGQIADAVVIGSRIIEEIEQSGATDDVCGRVEMLVRQIRTALDELKQGD